MLTPEGAKRLKEFPSLQLLFFNGSSIDDSVLEAISDLPNLTHLSLNDSRTGDSGLAHAAKLPKLQRLELSQTAVTSVGLRVLENAPSLQEITLMGRQFDDQTLENLRQLRYLKNLAIHGGSVTDEGLKYLVDYPQLESFVVSCPEIPAQASQITDMGLESIGKTKISRLFIARAAITDVGLKHLEKMTTLRNLSLRDTQVTPEGIESLEKALPAVRIMAQQSHRSPPMPRQ
jgi:Ran GTPase-activating protein (RanGAP) involved in mRNA processing and transport